jgi:hypothetical protein
MPDDKISFRPTKKSNKLVGFKRKLAKKHESSYQSEAESNDDLKAISDDYFDESDGSQDELSTS